MKTQLEQLMEDIVVCAKKLDSLISEYTSNNTSMIQRYSSDAERSAAWENIVKVKKEFDNLKVFLDNAIQ